MDRVIFACVHNAGRSQMAAALTHELSHGAVNVRSAGSMPELDINPIVVQAMTEVGVDISHEFPKPLTDEVVRAADVVVTMGCGDSCPVFPGKHYEDWDVADPAGQPLGVVRAIRDDIAQRVRTLLGTLTPAASA
jgi:arsenate reductase